MKILFFLIATLLVSSCIKKTDLFNDGKNQEDQGDQDNGDKGNEDKKTYIYPFSSETQNITARITIQTDGNTDIKNVTAEIPHLKYNKSWLFLFTQDDCKQAAFCRTWAAIHGKPLSHQYYYCFDHLATGDLPPDNYSLGKTLGCTDGAGNEVRFSFATTLAPEWAFMTSKTVVNPGFTDNYYRFYMKSGLRWNEVVEMSHFGTSFALHNVNTEDERNADSVRKHYEISQEIIRSRLGGRASKMLAEPDGNKTYIKAAESYDDIEIMTAQSGATVLYPFKVTDDLKKTLIDRAICDDPETIKTDIANQLRLPKQERRAISIGVHSTSDTWTNFLLWLNDQYGKDGDDSFWFPSLEEYYEYNYYRIHSSIQKESQGNTLTLTISIPVEKNFYYPSITVNLKGLQKQNVKSVVSDNAVTGLSYANHEGSLMINMDCRKFLVEHATHFVERYESDRSESNRRDALYFIGQLKDSGAKDGLLKRIPER